MLAADPGLRRLSAAHREALRDWSSIYSYLVQNLLFRTPEAETYGPLKSGSSSKSFGTWTKPSRFVRDRRNG